MSRGYFAIGIYHTKTETNVGTLWRSAYLMGAAYIFTIGRRYKPQASDTPNAWKHIPLFNYADFDDFLSAIPRDCPVIGIEQGGKPIANFSHPERCIYLLGAEDHGLPMAIVRRVHAVIEIPSIRPKSMNVSVAGSIVMYDRLVKSEGQ